MAKTFCAPCPFFLFSFPFCKSTGESVLKHQMATMYGPVVEFPIMTIKMFHKIGGFIKKMLKFEYHDERLSN